MSHEIDEFRHLLAESFPNCELSVDRPRDPKGEWWLDLKIGDFETAIAWRPTYGFGVFTVSNGFGTRPDETYRRPDLAARRIGQLATEWESNSSVGAMRLKDVRGLVNTPQVLLAKLMKVDQGAVSRFENRDDILISTLMSYVSAMGGKLEMRVHFDEFEAPISFENIGNPARPIKVGNRS